MGDERVLQLAYDASLRAVTDQASVLEGLRARAGTLFAAAALVTSFLGGQALVHTSHVVVSSWAGAAVACFVANAVSTLVILWPFRLRFSLSSQELIEIVDSRRAAADPVTIEEALRELALRLEVNYDSNVRTIRGLLWCLRLAILFLVGEVAAWIVVLWRI